MSLDQDVVDLKKHIKTLKCILEKAKEYPFLFNENHVDFCELLVSSDEVVRFYISKDSIGNLSLHFKDFNGTLPAPETLEYLAGKAVNYNLTPKDLIRSFSRSIARPLAEYNAKRESESLESQLLYQLEMHNP